MRALSIIFLLTIWSGYAQDSVTKLRKATIKDSIEISQTFNNFIASIEKKDKNQVISILLPKIHCDSCFETPDMYDKEPLVSAESFYDTALDSFTESLVYKALKKRSFRITIITHSNYKPASLPKEYSKDLTLYEIWISTFLENEWAPGHEGGMDIFQFVKIGDNFRLFGTSSVP